MFSAWTSNGRSSHPSLRNECYKLIGLVTLASLVLAIESASVFKPKGKTFFKETVLNSLKRQIPFGGKV